MTKLVGIMVKNHRWLEGRRQKQQMRGGEGGDVIAIICFALRAADAYVELMIKKLKSTKFG